MRLDGPGMRWSRGRSEWVLHLRCVLLNGQWDDFAAHLVRRGSLQLAATPTPTRSHHAAKRALRQLPRALARLPSLRFLHLGDHPFADPPAVLAEMTSLETLARLTQPRATPRRDCPAPPAPPPDPLALAPDLGARRALRGPEPDRAPHHGQPPARRKSGSAHLDSGIAGHR